MQFNQKKEAKRNILTKKLIAKHMVCVCTKESK